MRYIIYYQNIHDLKPQVFKRGITSIKEAESLVLDFQDACDGAFREAYEYGPTSVWYEPEEEGDAICRRV